ncbi:hypothetical protein K432DRAFT_444176 [Lepidopterella palustris CBS 459.81]|uniref:Uncharacterized protein n=1 Tax=Lepidopterella palustris CBS 459.81 TaxID=1314670 RepID=A0A8E2JE33_9PEZI|nr:hypothetical protein K432DRAFT_444176 [Lepidopterella palustris CBS 459.81]
MATPKLTHVFTFTMTTPPGIEASSSKYSNLTAGYAEDGGYIETADGSTKLKCIGATDWMLSNPNSNTITIDARASFIGEDGTNLDVKYAGKLIVTQHVLDIFSGKPGKEFDFGEEYCYTCPIISSRSEKFAWVNDGVFVAMGKLRVLETGHMELQYRVLKVG